MERNSRKGQEKERISLLSGEVTKGGGRDGNEIQSNGEMRQRNNYEQRTGLKKKEREKGR